MLLALLGPLIGRPFWQGFRAYAYPDQLTYASIATNWAMGDSRFVEPFTQTGTSHYPSLWYQAMGLVARLTGAPVHVIWTLFGVLIVSAAVLSTGLLAYRMSGRAWAPVLPALALFTGVLAGVTAGQWGLELLNHAILWGPLASLFTLNAEAAGTCLVIIAMVLLLGADPGNGGTYRRRSLVIAAAILGAIANVHTYAFFSGLVLAVCFAAVLSLLRSRSRPLVVVTVALLAIVLVAGAPLARVIGPLPVLALLLLAFAPAAVALARGHAVTAVLVVLAFGLAAAPQLVRTAWGLAEGDPFLVFRQVSSRGLGVAIPTGLLAAAPLILVGAACAVALWGRRQDTKSALLLSLLVGMGIMSQNDRWGFNQEPYRFWILFGILAGVLMTPVLAWSLAQHAWMRDRRRLAYTVVAVGAGAIWAVSLIDTLSFWHYANVEGVFSMEDQRAQAVRSLTGERDGLVLTSECLPPQVLKVMTGARIAHYNRGLAWPDNAKELNAFLDKERRAAEDPAQLQRAGVAYVLTDTGCPTDWDFAGDPRVRPEATREYADADGRRTLTLWRVDPA